MVKFLGFKTEKILTCLLLVIVGYFISKIFSGCGCGNKVNGFSVDGQKDKYGPRCDCTNIISYDTNFRPLQCKDSDEELIDAKYCTGENTKEECLNQNLKVPNTCKWIPPYVCPPISENSFYDQGSAINYDIRILNLDPTKPGDGTNYIYTEHNDTWKLNKEIVTDKNKLILLKCLYKRYKITEIEAKANFGYKWGPFGYDYMAVITARIPSTREKWDSYKFVFWDMDNDTYSVKAEENFLSSKRHTVSYNSNKPILKTLGVRVIPKSSWF